MGFVINKYRLDNRDASPTTVLMPKGSIVLTAHQQNNAVYIWALVDISVPGIDRNFLVLDTGVSVDILDNSWHRFIGTVFVNNGKSVWHVFEIE